MEEEKKTLMRTLISESGECAMLLLKSPIGATS